MEGFLLFLRDNPFSWGLSGIIALALACIGIILSIKRKQLLYIIQTDYIIEKNKVAIDNLSIMYNNAQIDNLMISKIAIVNSGNITINSSDVPVASPLFIDVKEDCKILSASVLEQSNTSSLVNVTIETPSSINITFDYFDKRDGAIIQVIHTGTSRRFNYHGKLKGGQIVSPPSEGDSERTKYTKQFAYNMMIPSRKFAYISSFLLMLLYIAFTIMIINAKLSDTISNSDSSQIIESFFIPLSMLTILVSILSSVSKKSALLVPKCLRKYFR